MTRGPCQKPFRTCPLTQRPPLPWPARVTLALTLAAPESHLSAEEVLVTAFLSERLGSKLEHAG
jgi:hypothetical protein